MGRVDWIRRNCVTVKKSSILFHGSRCGAKESSVDQISSTKYLFKTSAAIVKRLVFLSFVNISLDTSFVLLEADGGHKTL